MGAVPVSAWAAIVAPHVPVIIGLLIGTLGRFGLEMDEGAAIEARKVRAHLMMLGVLGLLAEAAAEVAHATPNWRAILGAGAALASAKVVRRFRQKSEQEADRRMPLDPPQP